MLKYKIRNFCPESQKIVDECGGRVFALLGALDKTTALVEVPPARGFVYRHKELIVKHQVGLMGEDCDTLILKEVPNA